jgi:hypothetical protein
MTLLQLAVLSLALKTATARDHADRIRNPRLQELVIPPYLELVVFDIFHGARNSGVTIFPPDVLRPLQIGAEGVDELRTGARSSTIAVQRPLPGRWTFVKSDVRARVRICVRHFTPRGMLTLSPVRDVLVQRDHVALTYQLFDARGRPLRELTGYPLALTLSLLKPKGGRETVAMYRDSGASSVVFRSRAPLLCDQAGQYWTRVHVDSFDVTGRATEIFQDHWSGFSVIPGCLSPRPQDKREGVSGLKRDRPTDSARLGAGIPSVRFRSGTGSPSGLMRSPSATVDTSLLAIVPSQAWSHEDTPPGPERSDGSWPNRPQTNKATVSSGFA